jgi:hypothetical protein
MPERRGGQTTLAEHLNRPNLTRLIPLALARDLRHERDVRLRDAGQETDKSIYLDDVFIDLPLLRGFEDKREGRLEPTCHP